MNKMAAKLILILASATLAACSSNPFTTSDNGAKVIGEPGTTANNAQPIEQVSGSIGGPVGGAMSEADRTKMWRALDSAPGKSSQWISTSNGASYTVTPIQKVSVNGNTLCRTYRVTTSYGGKASETNGTACITADGNWHAVSN